MTDQLPPPWPVISILNMFAVMSKSSCRPSHPNVRTDYGSSLDAYIQPSVVFTRLLSKSHREMEEELVCVSANKGIGPEGDER